MRLIRRGGGGRGAVAAVLAGMAMLALTMTAGAQAKTRKSVHGTVVHRDARAGSFVVASGKGKLFAIHSASSPALGTKVKVGVRKLANGTYGATSLLSGRHHSRARVHGRVSHVSGDGTSYTVSARGVSMLIHVKSGGAAPAVGTIVTVTGTIEEEDQNEEAGLEEDEDQNEGNLEEEDLQEEGEDNNGFVVEGSILGIDPLERTLTISADDDQESGETVVVKVPPSFDMSLFTVGQEVELNVLPLGGGQFELLGSADDEGEQGADDDEDEQGELGGEDEQGEDEQ